MGRLKPTNGMSTACDETVRHHQHVCRVRAVFGASKGNAEGIYGCLVRRGSFLVGTQPSAEHPDGHSYTAVIYS
jgi:hypothetical protein